MSTVGTPKHRTLQTGSLLQCVCINSNILCVRPSRPTQFGYSSKLNLEKFASQSPKQKQRTTLSNHMQVKTTNHQMGAKNSTKVTKESSVQAFICMYYLQTNINFQSSVLVYQDSNFNHIKSSQSNIFLPVKYKLQSFISSEPTTHYPPKIQKLVLDFFKQHCS